MKKELRILTVLIYLGVLGCILGLFILFRFYQKLSVPICGEKGIEYPAVIRNFSQIEPVPDDSICNQITALEIENSERTNCRFDKINTNDGFVGLVSVDRENLCHLARETDSYKTNFYALVTPTDFYPLNLYGAGILWSSNFVDQDLDCPKISLEANKAVANFIAENNFPVAASIHFGEYLYYWGQQNEISCLDMDLPEKVKTFCLLSGIDNLYSADPDKATAYMKILLNNYGSCRAIADEEKANSGGSSANVRLSVINKICNPLEEIE
ncbi:MAG: hypothetical protein UX09_C0029G0022 [Candidatus Uhrbacteria bacterium GW2011_GWE2_45_35]|uniref:Uncharacterized protein n=1 Tax=Candidatus Uhrbacteria bacterium GW2011_GWE2_45_35 TaxID=1618993 RepID=A0A0G1PPY6_9BACT|nr:MAG: hypothetical protein UX09_C0029G0022 [Candidatus Uhrbacteria bacterium GW2011_GWE2_45_35]